MLTSAGYVLWSSARVKNWPVAEISFLRDEDIDDLTKLIDRPIQIDPLAPRF